MAGLMADSKVATTAAMKVEKTADSMVARKADWKAAWKVMRSVAMKVEAMADSTAE